MHDPRTGPCIIPYYRGSATSYAQARIFSITSEDAASGSLWAALAAIPQSTWCSQLRCIRLSLVIVAYCRTSWACRQDTCQLPVPVPLIRVTSEPTLHPCRRSARRRLRASRAPNLRESLRAANKRQLPRCNKQRDAAGVVRRGCPYRSLEMLTPLGTSGLLDMPLPLFPLAAVLVMELFLTNAKGSLNGH